MNCRGQTLVETAFFFGFFSFCLGALVITTRWILIHEKVIAATREAALLYSSGHLTKSTVERLVYQSLKRGWPALGRPQVTVRLERAANFSMFHLDQITVTCRPDRILEPFFKKEIQEQCVIKHAPRYGPPLDPVSGPAVKW